MREKRGLTPVAKPMRGFSFACGRLAAALAAGLITMAGLAPAMANMDPEILKAFGLRASNRGYAEEVADLQRDLIWVGHYNGANDGQISSELREAIRNFQQAHGYRPTGELGPEERAKLRSIASITAAGQEIKLHLSDWTGIEMKLPMGFLSQPKVTGDDFRDLSFDGRAAVTFALRQIRIANRTDIDHLTRALIHNAQDEDDQAVVLAQGRAGSVGYLLIEGSFNRDYVIIASQGDETRAIIISVEKFAQAALQPVVLTMLESLDLFAGKGVSDAELTDRLVSGDYPGVNDRPAWYRSMKANGSGSLVSTEGHILTNHHVVATCDELTVNGRGARLIGADVRTDLAVIQSDHFSGREPVSLRTSLPQVGEKVISIGYPVFQLTQAQNITDGVISSLYGLEGDMLHLQVTAPIQPGNSGGPVLDAYGRQVAIVVAKPSEAARSKTNMENVAWVIRGEVAVEFLTRYGIRFIRDRGAREAMSTAEVAAAHRQQALRIECH